MRPFKKYEVSYVFILTRGRGGGNGNPPHLSKPLLYITVLKTLIYVIIHVKLFVVKYFFLLCNKCFLVKDFQILRLEKLNDETLLILPQSFHFNLVFVTS